MMKGDMEQIPTTKLIILGTGGSSRDVLDAVVCINAVNPAAKYDCVGFLDDDESRWGKEIVGMPILGPLSSAPSYPDSLFINGIGSAANHKEKASIIARSRVPLERFATIIHPTAVVSPFARLSNGVVALQHVTVATGARVGAHVIILPSAVVSHDVVVGDFTCIASGVCIAGGVKVGRSCYLGTKSAIRENVRIGERCIVGMGSVVLRDVEDDCIVVGSPARVLRRGA